MNVKNFYQYPIICLLTIVVLVSAGCRRKGSDTIVVASKNFTEQLILGEMMAQIIEADTGMAVERKFNLGGTMICHSALIRGDIDVYAEYTGTALTAILKHEVISDPAKAYRFVADAYEEYGCVWLKPFGFNNTYTITVSSRFAEKHDIKSISDLTSVAEDLVAGFTAEFMEREDGYKGLRSLYGIRFKDTMDMDPALMYRAIDSGKVDVICAFATDGRIEAYDLAILEDDRGFFPPYYASPVVRADTKKVHPDICAALEKLAGRIDDTTMRKLNAEVDDDGHDPAQVARAFLVQDNLIKQ